MIELVYGGSGSGKSEFAEKRVLQLAEKSDSQSKYYVATMIPFGKDAEQRIQRHRQLRAGKGFETKECPVDLGKLILESKGTVLLECLGNLTANEMFRDNQMVAENEVAKKIIGEIRIVSESEAVENLVIVSNNVFEDGIEYDEGSESYMRALGKINLELAKMADKVTEVVAGIPVTIKGLE